jgi:hypothetical protein
VTITITERQVAAWVKRYVSAWTTYSSEDIAALFTKDATYDEWPYATSWAGREAIVAGWAERQDWQEGGWEFDWSLLMITGDTAAIQGTGTYRKLGTFANLWTVTFGTTTKCRAFRMWNNEVSGV